MNSRLTEWIGQERVLQWLRLEVGVALSSGTLPAHFLLRGEPGLGKTALAEATAEALQCTFVSLECQSLGKHPGQALLWTLAEQQQRFVLFLDEIHRLSEEALEPSYSALTDYALVVSGLRVRIPPFCLIGATTNAGYLPRAFRSRLDNVYDLVPYTSADLVEILKRHYRREGSDGPGFEDAALEVLASVSFGNPRLALRHLRRASVYARGNHHRLMRSSDCYRYLEFSGIDRMGLDETDRRLLGALAETDRAGVGLQHLASVVGLSMADVERDVEPKLLRSGLLARTGRGRTLTDRGRRHLEGGVAHE